MPLQQLRDALGKLHALHPEITVAQAMTFLEIAMKPGISVSELQEKTKATQSCVSQRIRRLSSRESVKGCLGLIQTAIDKRNESFRKISLSKHGERLIRQLSKD